MGAGNYMMKKRLQDEEILFRISESDKGQDESIDDSDVD